MIYDSSGVARLAGWAVLAWLAARAKQHKVEIPAIDWLACHQGHSLCVCVCVRLCVCLCLMGEESCMDVCLRVHLSIVNRGTDSGVSGASQPLSAELINRLRSRTCVCVWVCVTVPHLCLDVFVLRTGRECLCMHAPFHFFLFYLNRLWPCFNCFLPPPVPDSTCCCGCHPIPQRRKVASDYVIAY